MAPPQVRSLGPLPTAHPAPESLNPALGSAAAMGAAIHAAHHATTRRVQASLLLADSHAYSAREAADADATANLSRRYRKV